MSFQFIEISPTAVSIDRDEVARDDGFVYEHLKRYCSKFAPLPAITVNVNNGKFVVVAGHKYASIAQELGHDRIRAIVRDATFEELRKQGVHGLLSAVPTTLLEAEQRIAVVFGWHVFFFKSAPPQAVAAEIDTRFRSFLNRSLPPALGEGIKVSIESRFDFSGPCLEIRFPTPVANVSWAKTYQAFALSLSAEVWPIETYQGRRFID